jgi:2,3-dihydroxy-p-cumate/2,3-dihydroxybenzoate 3,4-dioxygenase
MTLQPSNLGYVAFDVADLEASTRFYQDLVHLEVVNQREDTVFLRGNSPHHWVVLQQSRSPRFNRVAFEMRDENDLEEMEKVLKGAGVEVTHGGDLQADGVDRYIRFRDPDGMMVELFTNMYSIPIPPVYLHHVRLEKLVHAVFNVKDVMRSHKFYTELLGFRDSDWMERRFVFLHCGDRYHHSLAIGQGAVNPTTPISHICIQVAGIDDLARARTLVKARNVPLRRDWGRHAASGSYGFYFWDEANHYSVEFCLEHRQVDLATHKARVLPMIPEAADVWLATGPVSRLTPPAPIAAQSPRPATEGVPREQRIDEPRQPAAK